MEASFYSGLWQIQFEPDEWNTLLKGILLSVESCEEPKRHSPYRWHNYKERLLRVLPNPSLLERIRRAHFFLQRLYLKLRQASLPLLHVIRSIHCPWLRVTHCECMKKWTWWDSVQRAWISTSNGLAPFMVTQTAELAPSLSISLCEMNKALGFATGSRPFSSMVKTPTCIQTRFLSAVLRKGTDTLVSKLTNWRDLVMVSESEVSVTNNLSRYASQSGIYQTMSRWRF